MASFHFRMELVTRNVEAFHPGVNDSDALSAGADVECAFDLEAGPGRRRRINSTTARRSVSGARNPSWAVPHGTAAAGFASL
jgi:hypothetical protein